MYRRREPEEGSVWGFERAFDSSGMPSAGRSFVSPWNGAELGRAIALGPDVALLGAPAYRMQGAAFIHRREGDTWSQAVRFIAGEDEYRLGAAVALAGGRAAVKHEGTAFDSVQLYERSGDIWSVAERLPDDGVEVESGFGDTLALADDTLWVGAPGGNGMLYGYRRTGGAWANVVRVRPRRGAASFGRQIALHGGALLVSASPDIVVALFHSRPDDVVPDAGTSARVQDAGSDGGELR